MLAKGYSRIALRVLLKLTSERQFSTFNSLKGESYTFFNLATKYIGNSIICSKLMNNFLASYLRTLTPNRK